MCNRIKNIIYDLIEIVLNYESLAIYSTFFKIFIHWHVVSYLNYFIDFRPNDELKQNFKRVQCSVYQIETLLNIFFNRHESRLILNEENINKIKENS